MTTTAARLEAVLADIARRNATFAIYTAVDAAGARAAARAADARHARGAPLSPVDGLLVAVKDNIDVAGLATTAGLGFMRDRVAADDAFVTARLRAAGAVIVGKVNMHAAAFGATGRNRDFGDCANPGWPGLTAGGSSSGSAAAVAAGWADVALGTDTMGSVRVPAAYCGLAGFKPGAGVISRTGVVPLCLRLDHVGLVACGTAMLARALPAAAGYDPADPASRDDAAALSIVRGPLRAPRAPFGTAVEPDVWARFEAALGRLARAGCVIERFDAPACDLGGLRRAGLLLTEAEMLVTFAAAWRTDRSVFPDDMAAAMAWADGKSASDAARAATLLDSGIGLLRALMGEAPVLLLPTATQVPFPIEAAPPANQADLTVLANIAGVPALSLPLPCTGDERPVGLQVIGRAGSDAALLELGVVLEAALAGD